MKAKRLAEIKALTDTVMFGPIYTGMMKELITALEEEMRTSELIRAIFEAGGDLQDLSYSNNKFYIQTYIRMKAFPVPGGMEYFDTLNSALQFILNRTKEK